MSPVPLTWFVADTALTALQLNPTKCEIVAVNEIKNYHIFKDFKHIRKENLTFLGAPVLEGPAVDKALADTISELQRSIGGFTLLHAHDAL